MYDLYDKLWYTVLVVRVALSIVHAVNYRAVQTDYSTKLRCSIQGDIFLRE